MIHEYGLLIGNSKIHIKSDNLGALLEAVKEIERHIKDLMNYIRSRPHFQYSLKPISPDPKSPPIVQRMIEASKAADVGPMAAVAGAIADLGLETLIRMGSRVAVVEDGGEIAAYTEGEGIPISILTSEPNLSGKLGFLITRDDSPLGIATSTGRSQRTISFGEADSVTVVAESAALADAAATSICNSVVGQNIREAISRGLRRAREISGVRGAIIIWEGHVGLVGKLPKMISIRDSQRQNPLVQRSSI
ncbi:MAG: UPF0280 family protein [Candidatus Bathyarchaeia archaeon]|nr:UPF0280 family protein [Candidatus Bathyarchaeota archaeon]